MSISMKAMLASAALAGLMTGTSATLHAQSQGQGASAGAVQQDDNQNGQKSKKDTTEKHGCKGQNSCKGKGGCSASDNGCKGKNSCQGKGGCATDGSKMHEPTPEPHA